MLMELLIQGIYRYREFLIAMFPYSIIAMAIATDGKIKNLILFFIISAAIFSFVPTIDQIKEAQYLSRVEEFEKVRDTASFCQSATKKEFKK